MRSRPPSKPTIVRGVTYYKAQSTESENDIEEQRELGLQPCPAGWLAASLSKASACPRVLPCPPGTCGQSLWGHRGEEGLEAGGGGTIGTAPLEAARRHPAFEPCAGEQGGDVIPWKKSLVAKEIGHCYSLKHPAPTPFQKVNASLLITYVSPADPPARWHPGRFVRWSGWWEAAQSCRWLPHSSAGCCWGLRAPRDRQRGQTRQEPFLCKAGSAARLASTAVRGLVTSPR